MGAICDNCLKQKQQLDIRSQLKSSEFERAHLRGQNNSEINIGNAVLIIQTQSILEIDSDIMVFFCDNGQAIFNNPFVKNLNTSLKAILKQRIKQKEKLSKQKNNKIQSYIKISDPLYDVPIKKIVIIEMKVWDGYKDQKKYLNQVLQKFFQTQVKPGTKSSIAIAEIEADLGYNVKEFQRSLLHKLVQHNKSLSKIVYLTKNKESIRKFIEDEKNLRISTQSSSVSNKSNYY